jgi:imidazolonepropionase-like amidohydrolase
MRIPIVFTAAAITAFAPPLALQQPPATQSNVQASLIEPPADVPATATRYSVLMMGNQAGVNIVWHSGDATHAFFAFNDRGRGPRLIETYSTAPNGTLRSFELSGNDYYKTTVAETFAVANGRATWKNQAESGSKEAANALYVPFNGGPADSSLLLKAALANGGSIALLPEGQARVERVLRRELQNGNQRAALSLYAITGLDLTPSYLWADEHNDVFAEGESWMLTIRQGWESSAPELLKAQSDVARARAQSLAAKLGHKPAGPVVFEHVSLFDSNAAAILPDQTVIVSGNHIDRVGPAAEMTIPNGATVIDGAGKTLLPGLWDMHAHVAPNDGMMNLAVGVTTVRDLANDTDELEARRTRIDSGEEIGTRIFPAGFIDGPGPYQGPTKILASTETQARDYVRWYAGLGYRQIKIYSSLNPSLVPAIIDEAHTHGMRVSGHIPAGMTAADGVRAGMDEIQHANFLLLNFMPDVKDKTMTPVRFTEVARRGASIDVNGQPMRDFIALLKEHHVTIDPTVAIFEEMLVNRPGQVPESYAQIAPRLPAQFRRGLLSGGLPVPDGMDQTFKDSFANMLRLVKVMYDAGIPVESGTDSIAGFTLERELELHVKAGIPAPRVLADATVGAARIMKADDQLGSITAGKLADVVLVDGHPETNINDIRRPTVVMKDGVIYYPNELDRELGIAVGGR